MKIKKISKSEKQTRKYKNYNILNSYSVSKGINEIDVSKLTYDKYIVGYFNNDKITIIKNKKDNGIVKFDALEDGEYILYAKDYNRLLMLLSIFIFMLMMVVGKAAYSNIPIIKDTIEDIYLDVTKKDVPTVPKVKTDDNSKNNSWSKESIIYVTGASDAYSGIKYYEYCIRDDKNFNKCKWIKTKTQSVKITESGEHYVVFRGVSKRGEKGKISDPIKVLIDNDTPVIEEIIIDGNKVTIKATDDHSGIKEYYYKLDDGEYIKVDSEFEIPATGLHNITIKVVDKAGNYIEVEKTIVIPEKKDLKYEEISNNSDTELTEEQKRELKKWITLNLYYPEESTDRMYLILNPIELKDGYVANEWINYEHPITVRIEDVNKIYIKYMLNGDEIIEGPNGEITIHKAPKINLDKVPSNLYYGDTYELPSYYWFDEDGGNVECKLDLKNVITNTSEIPTGIHLISCTATANNGLKVTVKKEVTVDVDKTVGLIDGWIRMNLYYPEGSTDWEWMIQNPSEIRSGYEANTWTPYTEPILVKLSDVENVYIRYKLGDKVYIVPANGKLLVNIEPDRYVLNSEETTNVKINFDEEAEVKEYRMNYGEWTTYTSDFEAPVNSLIEARVIKNVKVYDSNGNYSHTTKKQDTDAVFISERVYASSTPETTQTSSGLSVQYLASNNLLGSQGEYISSPASLDNIYRLAGPIISSNPSNEIVENTQVTVEPQEEAEKIYVSVDYNSYKEYTVPITVDKNCIVRAYYIRKSDGLKSEVTYYRVSNIYEPSLPYVRIDTNPTNYLSEKVDKVTVTISGQNYDKLEYSYNGKLYYEYKEPIEVTQSSTIYARGINDVGEKIEKLTITTENPPIKKGELDVSISLNPDYTNKEGLLNETIVTIDYDIRAEKKYYRLGNGETREYTGPFKLRENTTIYAYGESSNRYGEAEKRVDFLTTGINSPDIITNTDDLTDEVEVSINYAKNAEVKKYKIDNSNWITYTGPFTVYENCTIYAYNEDILGNKNASSKVINNITYIPKYTILDEGTYFLLRLNYPDSSSKDTREYKWTPQGEWKVYDDKGILLIDYSQKGKVETSDGVKVRDRNGNEITMTDHYYFTDLYNVNLEENLFMRFNARKPDTPQIKLDTYDATKVSKVSIIYDFSIGPKLYKIVNGNEESEWLEYEGPFEIEKNNTIIYAKNQNSAEKWSDIASYKIVNIDDIKPTVSYDADFETPKQRVTIQIKANDNLGIDKVGYIKGQHDENSCRENAEFIRNYTTFNVSENVIYTICAIDNVGNVTTKEIEITNIDLAAPDIEINDLSTEFSDESEIEIDFGDSTFKQYRIGTTGEWINYTGKFTIKANDVLDKANEDFTLTIYAKGQDSAGNEQTVNEKIYSIDLDAPAIPEVTSLLDYATLTLDGATYVDSVYITYDNTRDDITNYYCLKNCDNDNNWRVYDGTFNLKQGTVQAKSVKNNSGLTISSSKDIDLPSDALHYEAYDNDASSSVNITNGEYKLNVDSEMWNHQLSIKGQVKGGTGNETVEIRFFDSANQRIGTKSYTNTTSTTEIDNIDIPSGATYMTFFSGSTTTSYIKVEELYSIRISSRSGESILSILSDNTLTNGYYRFNVNNQIYPVHLYVLNGNQTFSSNKTFGDASDVGGESTYAKNMVIVKVNGDLTINSNVTVRPYYTSYGGPKGFTLYVTGKLTNNGTIDNSHGAKAQGQDVYLWKNKITNNYENVPEIGALGLGERDACESDGSSNSATGRKTGGGATGGIRSCAYAGSSASGTSYSGGSGGGGVQFSGSSGSAEANGGAGGAAGAGGGSGGGNPGGANGTGGLLVIYANEYKNSGQITAKGAAGNSANAGGGGSGGGSINIFTNQSTNINKLGIDTNDKYTEMLGNINVDGGAGGSNRGGTGGKGTVNIGEIRNGQYYDLNEIIEQDKEIYINSVTKTGDSILSILEENTFTNGYYILKANNKEYQVHMYNYDGNQTFTKNMVFGDANDISKDIQTTNSTYRSYAQNMVVVKVNGNLTINSGVTVRPYYTSYGGPKGFTLYVTGKLTNNGIIDNSHGAYAVGEDVYLWKNSISNNYEKVPAAGANGIDGRNACESDGITGNPGSGRQTGGGATGGVKSCAYVGSSSAGTSYSGGTASGGVQFAGGSGSGEINGGSGGIAGDNGGAGAGNPGGSNGTGGLLVIYANEYKNNGTISAHGASGGSANAGGGGSGGGSINIFTNQDLNIDRVGIVTNTRYNEILGNTNVTGGSGGGSRLGGTGGLGTVNIGEIRNGQYYELTELIEREKTEYKNRITSTLTGDSILSILENNTFTTGYYIFNVNNKEYPVHLYNYEGNKTFTSNQTFGDDNDISIDVEKNVISDAYRSYAQNMVIVKVNGDLTINSNVTVRPYYTTYGGPKGFTLYVTGKLTNNGIIDNSHGAYAVGENVYLWKNTDGSYEYVPKTGGSGGGSVSGQTVGNKGQDGSEVSQSNSSTRRATGGGGSGSTYNASNSGRGSSGTSYSGGTGGGGLCRGGLDISQSSGSSNGGPGGMGTDYSYTGMYGGAGNPGQSGGGNGTGGLLVIYAGTYANNGTVRANGTSGYNVWQNTCAGGSSGGGSVNIFYRTLTSKGTAEANGPYSPSKDKSGGKGGDGTINYYQIVSSTNSLSSPKSLMGTRSITQVQPDTSGHKKLEYETPKINYNDGKISITYPQGYRNEYSFDANEWISYENEIDITENKVIFARTVDENGKVISSSSLNITTIPQEETKDEENNEQQSTGNELSDRIKQGEDIKLEGLCTANDEELTNISSLQTGNYHIICKNEEIIVLEKDIEIYSEE
ncbi:MAG: hypothetical protein E7158_01940 [Firmicutes bacterium]|nr:hypothetical protein [Bacillota bacterium]